MFNNMKNYNISNKQKGGGCMHNKDVAKIPEVPPVPKGQLLAQKINKLTLKWNAKSLLDQEASETLQEFITMAMSAVSEYEQTIKELSEELATLKKGK